MSIITRPQPLVKPTRRNTRPARPFGQGILPYVGQYDGRMPYTASDVRWAAQAFADAEADRESDEFDRGATEAAMLERYCRGNLPL